MTRLGTPEAKAVAPRVADLAHTEAAFDFLGATIKSGTDVLQVLECFVEVRDAPVHHRTGGAGGDLLVGRDQLQVYLADGQIFEIVRFDSFTDGVREGLLVPDEGGWNI